MYLSVAVLDAVYVVCCDRVSVGVDLSTRNTICMSNRNMKMEKSENYKII